MRSSVKHWKKPFPLKTFARSAHACARCQRCGQPHPNPPPGGRGARASGALIKTAGAGCLTGGATRRPSAPAVGPRSTKPRSGAAPPTAGGSRGAPLYAEGAKGRAAPRPKHPLQAPLKGRGEPQTAGSYRTPPQGKPHDPEAPARLRSSKGAGAQHWAAGGGCNVHRGARHAGKSGIAFFESRFFPACARRESARDEAPGESAFNLILEPLRGERKAGQNGGRASRSKPPLNDPPQRTPRSGRGQRAGANPVRGREGESAPPPPLDALTNAATRAARSAQQGGQPGRGWYPGRNSNLVFFAMEHRGTLLHDASDNYFLFGLLVSLPDNLI